MMEHEARSVRQPTVTVTVDGHDLEIASRWPSENRPETDAVRLRAFLTGANT